MPDYHFYKKGKQTIALEHWDEGEACRLLNEGYEKQPEEINAVTKKKRSLAFLIYVGIIRQTRIIF